MSSGKQLAYTEQDVANLSDLRQARKLLKANEISLEGLQSLRDCKDRLNQCLKKGHSANQAGAFTRGADVLKEIVDTDKCKRHLLIQLYKEVEKYVKSINESNRTHLNENVENYEEKIKEYISQLSKNECPILVAGETSSGKSSLLNLILGANILPVSLLSSTSAICELKYGERKRARVHRLDGSTEDIEDLGDDEQQCLEKLEKYIHKKEDREKGSLYSKVEIFWPFSLLQGGLFIVDSPGIGENREMTNQVMSYLPNAFGFIYVVNSANAGGVQQDRLQKLLRSVSAADSGDHLRTFDPKSAIFVCNKWDQVPDNEEDLVKADTLQKLSACWEGLDEHQVFYVSSQKAELSLKAVGLPTGDFDKLLDGIERLLPISLKYKLKCHFDWLLHLMSRSLLHLRTKLYNANLSTDEMTARYKYIQERLVKCKDDAEKVFQDIEQDLEEQKKLIVNSLQKYLAEDCLEAITHWTEADGVDLRTMDAVDKHARTIILKRIEGLVYDWDGDNFWFKKARQHLQSNFKEKFGLLEDYLAEVEEAMSVGRSFELKPFGSYDDMSESYTMTTSAKIALGASAPILVPLAVVASVVWVPAAGIYAIHRRVSAKKKLDDYRKNKVRYLQETAKEVLKEFCERENLERIVHDQFDDLDQSLAKLRELVPKIINADRKLMESVNRDRQMAANTKDEYTKLYRSCFKIISKLNLYHLENLREYEFRFEDLRDWNPLSAIASGSFADVYHATLVRENTEVPIALKVLRENVTPDLATDYVAEEEALRKLAGPHIVKFYGSALRRGGRKQLAMAFELCVGLRDFIFNFKERIPAKHAAGTPERRSATNVMKDMARQLVSALVFIHEKGYIHRDMKIDNVLVDNNAKIKLADLGLTKREQDVINSFVGSIYYMPPEMLTSKKYNNKADIYSLGLIIWEMWYGEYAYEDEDSGMLDFITKIRGGYRPDVTKKHEPSDEWKDLMKKCWLEDPSARPTATECLEIVNNIRE
ncbi:uncharacterized protein [Ptychodera flava]|uniref:uncharacterized protein n=1 Tax=Ptychodera flava TaxID=63121 RepID=UPI00396A807A